ncbi:MAG: SGNH/GDSL hydrolase family protein [Ruminococcaceae bacterium]|nr:SGNH/GDSL hydrolase family protein [Oscillospiraceae bacterium]
MKKVLLIGDSIRKGYDKSVAHMLSSFAETYYPEENCRFASYTLRFIHEWPAKCGVKPEEVDVVHWNTGLWDCLVLFDDGPHTPIAAYTECIERLCRRMKLVFPNAKCIFATSTPVDEEGWKEPSKWLRRNADIRAYNAAAAEIAKKYGMAVNDLFGLLENAPRDWHSDQTHFYTMPATVKLTRQVAGAICAELGCDLPQMSDEEILKNAPTTVKVYGI